MGNWQTEKLSGKRWETIREIAYKRDRAADAPCWICGQPIDYRAKSSNRDYNPRAWEPDHVLPRSEYPELTYDLTNIRPSHAYCNRSRGQSDGAEAASRNRLGKRSRDWGIDP